jgi:hypothetical protein
MKTKEYHFELLEHWLFSFNKYWEKPLGETRLRTDTEDAIEDLTSYCKLIKSKLKKYNGDKDYTKYPEDVQRLIQEVLNIVTDGRELHEDVEFEGRKYNHHCNINGYLDFENNPLGDCDKVIEECKKIKEVLESENATKDLSRFIGKTLEFENYEDGSAIIYIKSINRVNNNYVFTGYIVTFETVNGHTGADGVLIYDVEDCKFSDIPCAFLEDQDDIEDLEEILDNAEETTLAKVKENIILHIKSLFEQTFSYAY